MTSRNPVVSVRVGQLTRTQADELCARWGMSLSTLVTVLIDRAYQQENRIMNPYAANPNNLTQAEADALAILVYDAAYPNRMTEKRDPDELENISDWLCRPGGIADHAEPDSLAAEWLQVQAESANL